VCGSCVEVGDIVFIIETNIWNPYISEKEPALSVKSKKTGCPRSYLEEKDAYVGNNGEVTRLLSLKESRNSIR
jgi:hypothetical protein